MNKKVKQNYEELAQNTNLRFDETNGVLYGQRSEYSLLVYAPNESYPYQLLVTLSAKRTSGPLSKAECKAFVKSSKPVASLNQKENILTMSVRASNSQNKLRDNLNEALKALTDFLRTNGFTNCCQLCGQTLETDPCAVHNSYMHLCPDCFTSVSQNETLALQQKAQTKENLIGGIVGALLGTLLGVASIILLSQLGYIAALSGVIMAVCTLKGYELLGGKLSKKGLIICIVLMILMTYVGDRMDWAIMVMRELETDFAAAYQFIPELLSAEIIEPVAYWGNLVLVYLFVILGAFPTIRNSLKTQSSAGRICRIKATDQTQAQEL